MRYQYARLRGVQVIIGTDRAYLSLGQRHQNMMALFSFGHLDRDHLVVKLQRGLRLRLLLWDGLSFRDPLGRCVDELIVFFIFSDSLIGL